MTDGSRVSTTRVTLQYIEHPGPMFARSEDCSWCGGGPCRVSFLYGVDEATAERLTANQEERTFTFVADEPQ